MAHDEIEPRPRRASSGVTDRAGGIEGGMTNGEVLRVRAAMKPISTVPRALATVDVATGEAAKAINQRSDVCAVPAAASSPRRWSRWCWPTPSLEKFGGDSVEETAPQRRRLPRRRW